MLDLDTQKELPKETVSLTKALEAAIHMEMGAQYQQKRNQNLNTNAQSVNSQQFSKPQSHYELPTSTKRIHSLSDCFPKLPIYQCLRKLWSTLESQSLSNMSRKRQEMQQLWNSWS